jgi:hypothetical protein
VRDFGKNARRTADPFLAVNTGERAPVTASGRASAAALRRKVHAGITIETVGSSGARDAGVTGQVKLRGAGIQGYTASTGSSSIDETYRIAVGRQKKQ